MASKMQSAHQSYDTLVTLVPHDLELISQDGVIFKAHKMVLCKVSPYFSHLFQSDIKQCQTDIFRLSIGYPQHIVRQVVLFVYENKLQINKDSLMALLQVADEFNMTTLTTQCEDYLWNLLNRANCDKYNFTADIHCLSNRRAIQQYYTTQKVKVEQNKNC